ncbi:MAG: SPFH domain-containing protein [Ardenticatenaceae bacterium]|nr:SPFH domain-containing protein [Ardenticatenaceae bacterium]
MKSMIQFFGRCVGKQLAPDNCVVPILRLDRFHRLGGPGYFQINPFMERTLSPVSVGLRVGEFSFQEVQSQDNIPFDIKLTVLYQFVPDGLDARVISQIVRLEPRKIEGIVRSYASQGLRRLAASYPAADLSGTAVLSAIERDLTGFLRGNLHALGLVPLRQGGILIKETVPPERFKQTMLLARQHHVTLDALSQYRDRLNEMAIRAQFLAGLERFQGNLALLSTTDSLPPVGLSNLLNLPPLQPSGLSSKA